MQGGVRYTDDKRNFTGCVADGGDGLFALSFQNTYNYVFRPLLGLPPTIVIPPGGCVSADPTFTPELAHLELHQHNVSWRGGLNYKPNQDALLYANISRGYKAGTFPSVAGVAASEFDPTTQESVLAYEAGFKLGLFEHRLQLDGAAFYYDYTNKQVRGKVADPYYGTLERLINIPKSRVDGAEVQLTARPVSQITLNVGATYLNSKVTRSFLNFSAYGTPIDFKGQSFPYTPTWQVQADAEYDFHPSQKLSAFVGAHLTYNSDTVGFFGADIPYNPADPQHGGPSGIHPTVPIVSGALNINAYTLIDLRAGVASTDGSWRFMVWGRNVTNAYYWTNASYIPPDATVRFAGMPVTYGATLSYRY